MADRAELKQLYPAAAEDFLNLNSDTPDAPESSRSRVKAKRVVTDTLNPYKRHVVVTMPYPGCIITENHCYGRKGKHSYMKQEAQDWQESMIKAVIACGITDWKLPLKVKIEGVFKNERERPDLHNFKCLYDGIQKAIGINDKDFHTETVPGRINKLVTPGILITISEI